MLEVWIKCHKYGSIVWYQAFIPLDSFVDWKACFIDFFKKTGYDYVHSSPFVTIPHFKSYGAIFSGIVARYSIREDFTSYEVRFDIEFV
jgi:hypothetical protein